VIIDTDTISEDEAMTAYHTLAHRFGWAGTFFTRDDAQTEWRNQQFDIETGLEADADLPDDVWDAVTSSWHWRKGLTDTLTERGWEIVSEAVYDATHPS
jgi:hypothetical protein